MESVTPFQGIAVLNDLEIAFSDHIELINKPMKCLIFTCCSDFSYNVLKITLDY